MGRPKKNPIPEPRAVEIAAVPVVPSPPALEPIPNPIPEVVIEAPHRIFNPAMAGKSVFSRSGNPVFFDHNGFAEPCEMDFEHLQRVPGYQKAE